jgi:nucleoside-diphosphate-sugar epimerase
VSRILVAGGAGFIGSNLCERLVADGHTVVCMDNLITGRRSNIEAMLSGRNFEFFEHDASMPLPQQGAYECVYHLASPASPPGYMRHPIETLRANSLATMKLLELAAKNGARFLYASTSEVYGDPIEHPQRETLTGYIDPVAPRSVYSEGKRFGETAAISYHRDNGLDARIVRIFNTYGPRSDPEDGRIVPNFVVQALQGRPLTVYGDGSQTRSLCYVSDLVEGLVRTMDSDAATGQVINLGNPDEHSVLEYAGLIRELTKSDSPIVFEPIPVEGDPRRRRPDITRATELLGWAPSVPLVTGLAATVDYFRQELALGVAVGASEGR